MRVGLDTSKHVFELRGVNAAEQVVLRKRMRRDQMMAFFGYFAPTVVGMEACGDWARKLGDEP